MIKLHLGVMDIPYTNGGSSTGDVAEKLEQSYGIMEYFSSVKSDEIAKELEKDLVGFIDDSLNGRGFNSEPFKDSCERIEKSFRKALDAEFMAGSNFSGLPVPTQAAINANSSRFKDVKNKKKKRKARVSFVDTGTYRSSFKAWIEL